MLIGHLEEFQIGVCLSAIAVGAVSSGLHVCLANALGFLASQQRVIRPPFCAVALSTGCMKYLCVHPLDIRSYSCVNLAYHDRKSEGMADGDALRSV